MANNNERIVGGIKTRLLHNKDYVEVSERVRIAHAVEDDFEMVEDSVIEIAGRLLWRSVIRVKGKTYMGHAEVKLDAPKNTPDGTNPFECAETSAIGRALAFAGLGTVESIASYDEIARALPVVSVEPASQQRVVESGSQRQIPAPVAENKPQIHPDVKALQKRAGALGLAKTNQEWMDYKKGVLGHEVYDSDLTKQQISTLNSDMDAREKSKQEARV